MTDLPTPPPNASSTTTTSWTISSGTILAWSVVLLIRILVGYQPHSGQDDHHGAAGAYGGDFEAQRHWMEITYQLPIAKWYTYDLHYWGLDYPPLSAFQSLVCGALSHVLVGPDSVALDRSRGFEDATHKTFLRATVLVLDSLFYGTAAWSITKQFYYNNNGSNQDSSSSCWHLIQFVFVMLQPSILLMDHGHFQYNTTALGLALWAINWAAQGRGVYASIAFAMALSFKQMTLYYAPAMFAYLLGTCFSITTSMDNHYSPTTGTRYIPSNHKNNRPSWIPRFSWTPFWKYGAAVLLTTAFIWWPFVVYGPQNTTPISRLVHILRRIFPLHRGLFEDKVANIWCALSVKPLRLAQRIPTNLQPLAALVLTFCLSLPACIKLFQWGRRRSPFVHSRNNPTDDAHHLQILLLGSSSVALSFFLGAFHVHEKSILLAVAPASLALIGTPLMDWFTLTSTWSLFPLLILDRLQVAYVCLLVIYACARTMTSILGTIQEYDQVNATTLSWPTIPSVLQKIVVVGSACVMVALHNAQALVVPPSNLPDLFAVLWSMAGCGFFVVTWMGMVWFLYSIPLSSVPKPKGD